MILILSHPRERAAFLALCEAHGLAAIECESIRAFVRLIRRTPPRVLLVRHKLPDGFSDDAIAALNAAALLPSTKVLVLLGAENSSTTEARQLSLGADCVQRDPVRTAVLLAYLTKYAAQAESTAPAAVRDSALCFAGATVMLVERTVRAGDYVASLTPREIQLIEVLLDGQDRVVSYETLYHDVLQRRFGGDTSNMRVLLGKLAASLSNIGIQLREWVDVIPKAGYRYRSAARERRFAGKMKSRRRQQT